ncbi:MAG: DegT/DnrJ/EryC1/StrS family aminotransferase [Candidatus Omnitrophota bacterium]
MKREFIPWFSPQVGRREKESVIKVIESNYLNDGNYTRLFENKVAALIGAKHCVGVTSGTAAIALALMGMGIGRGDEVIVPDLTFIATANAVRLAGATVRLVDIEPCRFGIDIEAVIKNIGPRTKAIIPVDINGRAADYGLLEPLAKKRGLFMVCDATEGLGSRYRGRYLGTFGDAGCFSFSANKTVTTGQGGMIATNSTRLYHRLLELKDQGRRFQGTGGNDLHPVLGYNFKLTNLQAAVGVAQLEKLKARLSKARQRDKWYQDMLSDCPGLVLPCRQNQDGEVAQWADILVQDRKKLESGLAKLNIGYRPFWYPLHTQKPYLRKDAKFFNALDISSRGLWLPSFFDLTRRQAEFVSGAIRSILAKGRSSR